MAEFGMTMSRYDVECLQETLCLHERLIDKLYNELDEESEASASAASEALSMILRLQGEKAAEEMEAEQYKRFVEEKMSHAEESLSILQELINQKQMEIAELDYHARAYRYKLLSMGYDDDDIDVSDIDFDGEMSFRSIGRCRSDPNIPLKYASVKKSEKISPKRGMNDVTTVGSIGLYCEQIEKLEERVKQIAGANYAKLSSLPASKRSSCNNFLEHYKEMYLVDQRQVNKSENEGAASRCGSPPNVLDVFEVPRAIKDEDFVPKDAERKLVEDETAGIRRANRTTFEIAEVLKRQGTREEPRGHEELMWLHDIKEKFKLAPLQLQHENKLHRVGEAASPTTSASETAEIRRVNRTRCEIPEVERQRTRQAPDRREELMLLHVQHENKIHRVGEAAFPTTSASEMAEIRGVNRTGFEIPEVERLRTRKEPDRREELMLLHDIKEQLNLVPLQHENKTPTTSASETAEICRVNRTIFEIPEVEKHRTRQEPDRHKEIMLLHDTKEQLNLVPMQHEKKLHIGEAASPTTSASETADIRRVNRTISETTEAERQRTRQEPNSHDELMLLREIKEQLNSMQSDIKSWKSNKPSPRDEPSVVSLTEVLSLKAVFFFHLKYCACGIAQLPLLVFTFFFVLGSVALEPGSFERLSLPSPDPTCKISLGKKYSIYRTMHVDDKEVLRQIFYSHIAPMAANSSDNEVIVAMVPFSDYSHLNNLFDLARFIASHNIPVHLICFADQNKELKLRAQGGLGASNIHFKDLLRPSLTEKEDDDGRDGVPPVMLLLRKLTEPIHKICCELATNAKKLVIIHDLMMSDQIQDVHTLISNVESYIFHTGATFSRYSSFRQSIPGVVDDDDHEKLIEQMEDEFPVLEPHQKLWFRMEHELKLQSGEIINSCKEVEGKYLDLLANAKHKPLWIFGPFHLMLESHDSISFSPSNITRHESLAFLDKQDVNSVIFVSFGSTTTLSQEQINELALGLEQSNHRFIWVLRKGEKAEKLKEEDGKIELPEGFEERVEGRGMAVKWAPQLEILRHPSTGGFMGHSSTIEKAVKTLMGTKEGEEMRQRAAEMSKKIKSSVTDGGPARKAMESFISNIIK
ncbi:hypothetical protein CQW23_06805 [Capsicum baccatum]|uniref:GTD-binding domain-containing protein n=1 Tax=Capsicum baccatum TaxID=33114 RepID=A0A2G2X4G1_CAPBA|nr:hypothetical protein CQW23_06805 [Capsicum baccatum]